MTRFERILEGNRLLKAIYVEASKIRTDPDFCRNQLWHSILGASGPVGLKQLFMQQHVGQDDYDVALDGLHEALPPCNHAPNDCRGNYPNDPTSRSRQLGVCFEPLLSKLRRAGRSVKQ